MLDDLIKNLLNYVLYINTYMYRWTTEMTKCDWKNKMNACKYSMHMEL